MTSCPTCEQSKSGQCLKHREKKCLMCGKKFSPQKVWEMRCSQCRFLKNRDDAKRDEMSRS